MLGKEFRHPIRMLLDRLVFAHTRLSFIRIACGASVGDRASGLFISVLSLDGRTKPGPMTSIRPIFSFLIWSTQDADDKRQTDAPGS